MHLLHMISSRVGLLLLALLPNTQSWAESAAIVAGKGISYVVHPSGLQTGMAGNLRTGTLDEVFPAWDANLLLWFLLAMAGIGVALFWLGRHEGAGSHDDAWYQADSLPLSAVKDPVVAKANGNEQSARRLLYFDPASALEVENVKGVEKEAEVFFLLGRMDLAIGVLRHHIESSGDAPAHVWMFLLDILHAQGLRQEFEKLALEIRNRFNVALPSWEKSNERSHGMTSLEHFPHLFARITELWHDPQCIDYLRSLLQNDRNGERGGFHMDAFRELLFLTSLLEHKNDFPESGGKQTGETSLIL